MQGPGNIPNCAVILFSPASRLDYIITRYEVATFLEYLPLRKCLLSLLKLINEPGLENFYATFNNAININCSTCLLFARFRTRMNSAKRRNFKVVCFLSDTTFNFTVQESRLKVKNFILGIFSDSRLATHIHSNLFPTLLKAL